MKAVANEPSIPDSEFIVLYGIPWEMYEGILDALGQYHLRHTYDRGTLEMRRIAHAVAPEDYLKLLEATSDYHLRHTYDGWTLEMMSPRKDHDWVAELLGRMIDAMALALRVPIQSVGSMTLRKAKGIRGAQPDKAFYLASERRVRGRDDFIPGKDPPPDLVVEVEVTNSSLPRLPIFAGVGVREVWRHDGRRMHFHKLSRGKYSNAKRSAAFPFLEPGDIDRFLLQRSELDENSLIIAFAEWAKTASEQKSKRPPGRQGKPGHKT